MVWVEQVYWQDLVKWLVTEDLITVFSYKLQKNEPPHRFSSRSWRCLHKGKDNNLLWVEMNFFYQWPKLYIIRFECKTVNSNLDWTLPIIRDIDSGRPWSARAPPEFGSSEKRQSLISAYQRLAITASISVFERLSMMLIITS